MPGRNIEAMIDAVQELGPRFTLDVYLVPGGDGGAYLDRLKRRAAGCDRIAFPAPVPPEALPATLNGYDVGIFWIPPFNTNARLTLPNKIFDYVQARLAVAVGPTAEMVSVIERYGIGVSSDSNSVPDIVKTLSALTAGAIMAFKAASDRAAHDLSFEHEKETIHEILNSIASPDRSAT